MKNKKIIFVTSNRHKVEEMQEVLKEYGIELQQLNRGYPEDKEAKIEEVAQGAVKILADEVGKEVIVEDTGLYFEAYHNFPGPLPKFVFQGIGFEGIFRLLKGKSRRAFFKTVIGYCSPGQEPLIFSGIMRGTIIEEVRAPEADVMPYDHIFIPDGYSRVIAKMSLKEKNSFSQRAQATRQLGEYLRNQQTAAVNY
ncbi:non-canonical purine NTP pyrophosphatase [Candidatus Parcubacteria bacterium]|nr:MAG: non-canonical purine NTP pyrophosphatase [Candidatus Parcubacteria bacterium]